MQFSLGFHLMGVCGRSLDVGTLGASIVVACAPPATGKPTNDPMASAATKRYRNTENLTVPEAGLADFRQRPS